MELELLRKNERIDIARAQLPSDLNLNRLDPFLNAQSHFEPEVRAAMHWSLIYPFVLSGSFHGGALVANYPFNHRVSGSSNEETQTTDDPTFRMLANTYAQVNRSFVRLDSVQIVSSGSSDDVQRRFVHHFPPGRDERRRLASDPRRSAGVVVRLHLGDEREDRTGM